MGRKESEIRRPKRWDTPFGELMTDELVNILLTIPPFSSMDTSRFPSATPLRGILRNDARILDFANGDIIIREGDYGSSAFMILEEQLAAMGCESLRESREGVQDPARVGAARRDEGGARGERRSGSAHGPSRIALATRWSSSGP